MVDPLEEEALLVEDNKHQGMKKTKGKKVVETLQGGHLEDPSEEETILGADLEAQEEEIQFSLVDVTIVIKLATQWEGVWRKQSALHTHTWVREEHN